MSHDRPLSDYCTPEEAARIANVTARRIMQLLQSREIEGVKMGGRWLALRESVYRWSQERPH